MKMKTIVARWLCFVSLSGMPVPLQHALAQSDQDLIEVARSVVSADRKTVVVAAMELSEAESSGFWPLYREYRSAMDKINDELMNLVMGNSTRTFPRPRLNRC